MSRRSHRTDRSALTVMMPARNAAATVARAVTSTLRALPDNGTLLVLDDASTDETPEIVRRIARRDGRVGLLGGGDTALGIPAASNALLDESNTPLVARMDSDDITLPGRFTRQLRAIEHADFTFCHTIFYGPERWRLEPVPVFAANAESSRYELLVHDPFFHSAFLGRREVVDEMGGYRDVPSEDWDLFMRLAAAGGSLTRSAIPGIVYRRHATQITRVPEWKAAVVNSKQMAEAHDTLCHTVFGESTGAFRALAGQGATLDEVRRGEEVIGRVEAEASKFPLQERLSLRITTHGVRLRLHRRYEELLAEAA
ncbi:glycosyltransferase family 2 protein [Williamsia sterculiae]|uniref:Glycosyltransferase involved in cell wall bisynthesis n=1 Tax=Williamsia sterculiae TaxID=1344003 RepID=A0A1N7HCJ1_9NOCA|nr:glycosyltransferase [Williamsia sterculiae]SIS22471.1 Glycosyltransferase involved in cell wall bisynthesis [Williamsia sterculiae]